MLTGGIRDEANYRAVILSGGEAGVRDLTWADGLMLWMGNPRWRMRDGRSRQRYGRCTRIVGSLGGLPPSSG
jgi:hypothetical protein